MSFIDRIAVMLGYLASPGNDRFSDFYIEILGHLMYDLWTPVDLDKFLDAQQPAHYRWDAARFFVGAVLKDEKWLSKPKIKRRFDELMVHPDDMFRCAVVEGAQDARHEATIRRYLDDPSPSVREEAHDALEDLLEDAA